MRLILLLAVMSMGCVVRQYGGVPPASSASSSDALKPVDFSDVEARLETLIEAETDNVDRRDRLEAAWELCQKSKTLRPAAQHETYRYLMRLVDIERRIQDASTDAVASPDQQTFVPIAAIAAQRIADSDIQPSGASSAEKVAIVPPDAGAAAVMEAARQRMAANDLKGALEQLGVCQGQPCGAATVTLWREARDRYVYQRREAAGAAFLVGQKLDDQAARMASMQSVLDDLTALQREYPDSRYSEGVAASLATVSATIEAEGQQE